MLTDQHLKEIEEIVDKAYAPTKEEAAVILVAKMLIDEVKRMRASCGLVEIK